MVTTLSDKPGSHNIVWGRRLRSDWGRSLKLLSEVYFVLKESRPGTIIRSLLDLYTVPNVSTG